MIDIQLKLADGEAVEEFGPVQVQSVPGIDDREAEDTTIRDENATTEGEAMTRHTHVLVAACLCFAITMPVLEAKECFGIDARTTKKRTALVFEGTVIKAEQLQNREVEVTMVVHRIWKGKVGKQTTVYYELSDDGSRKPWETGKRLVIFTNVAFEGRPRLAQQRSFLG